MSMKKIRGHSRSRISIRPRSVRANVTRHYEAGVREDLDWEIQPPAVSTAPRRGS